jgi:CRP-like cAMP-binding protein
MAARVALLACSVALLMGQFGRGQEENATACVERNCSAGYQWVAPRGVCAPCPAGKQSTGALGNHCEACPHTLEIVPLPGEAFGSGCRCRPHHASPWSVSTTSLTSCISCGESKRLTGDDPRRASCEPCVDADAGVDCVGSERTCECAGGDRGQAFMCAAEGYFLLVDRSLEAAAAEVVENQSESDSIARVQRAYKLLRCANLGATLGSRCPHWRTCRPGANATCRPEVRSMEGFGDYYAMECCAEGYRGPLCEHCAPGFIQGGAMCLRCTRTSWERLAVGVACCFVLVAYIMESSVATFEEASAMSSILVFFLQTGALVMKPRFPDVMGVVNIMNFNFLKAGGFGGPGSCMVALDGFYYQWMLGIAVMPLALLLVYATVMLLTRLYSHQATISRKIRLRIQQIRSVRILDKVLAEQPVFRVLEPKKRHLIASQMKLEAFEQGCDLVRQNSESSSGFFIIIEGECAVKVDGRMVSELHSGAYFGERGLLEHSHRRTSTVTALTDVYVGMLASEDFHACLEEHDGEAKMKQQLDKMRAGQQGVTLASAVRQHDEALPNITSDLLGSETGGSDGSTFETEEPGKSDEMKREEALTKQLMTTHYTVARHRKTSQNLDSELEEEREVKEIRIDDKCCRGCCYHFAHQLHRTTRLSLVTFFRACADPTARQCGLLEISIMLYGTMTQELMVVWMCNSSLFDSSVKVLATDPTVHCEGAKYTVAFYGSIVAWFLVAFGVPLYMQLTATRFTAHFRKRNLRHEAEKMQKAVFGHSWNKFDEHRKEKLIEDGMHDLQIQQMSSDCFLLSKFQMSLTKKSAVWYQQWYMGRRLLLNLMFAFNERGLGSVVERSVLDWRVSAMLLLAISSMLQYNFRPFRHRTENR